MNAQDRMLQDVRSVIQAGTEFLRTTPLEDCFFAIRGGPPGPHDDDGPDCKCPVGASLKRVVFVSDYAIASGWEDNRLDSQVTMTPGQRLGSRHRYSYDSLRPLAQIQFFPDTCSVVTSANPA